MWNPMVTRSVIFKVLLTIILLLSSNISFAANGEIYGVVREAETGNPLPGANVMIKGSSLGAASNLEGRYLITNVPPGSYTLVFTYIGYEEYSMEIQIRSGQRLNVDANLKFKVIEGKVVTVTAQLEGQNAAINRQLTSNSIVNVVSAERIQEMPDMNASESVGRLPGISVMREGGEGQKVVIRGLAPTYNTVTVNGDKIPSSDLEDRSIDMSMISSDMLAGIEVVKAITPDRDADAFGGIIDFQLSRAPEGRFRSNLRLQTGYNAQQMEFGQYKNSFRMSQRFFNDALGIMVSGNMERSNRSADIYNASYSVEREKRPDEEFAPIRIDNLTLEDRIETLNRYGGNVMADYRFDRGEFYFNSALSRVHRDRTVNESEMDAGGNNDRNYNLVINDISKEIFTNSLGGKYRFSLGTVDARISHNQAVQVQPQDMVFEFTEGAAFDQVVFEQNKETLGADAILMAARNNIENAGINGGEFRTRKSKETDQTAQLNLTIPYNFLNSKVSGFFKLGGKFTSKERVTEENEYFERLYQETEHWPSYKMHHTKYGQPGFVYTSISHSNAPSVMNYLDPDYDAGTFLNGDFDFTAGLSRDELYHLAQVYLIDSVYTQDELSGLEDFTANEDVTAGYIMTELNLGPRLMILPGVRYERTYIKFIAKSSNIAEIDIREEGSVSDTTATHTYDCWFPMVHVRYRVTDWFDIRLASTRALSRPRLDWLNPSEQKKASSNTVNRGIIGLKPQIATNYDIFLSFHAYRLGLLTFGGFYKNIEDLIWRRNDMRIYKEDVESGEFPYYYKGMSLTQPENNPLDTEIYGFEFEWQTNFSWLPKPLNGIVLNVNYSRIFSETKYPFSINQTLKVPPFTSTRIDTFRTGPMPNQSDHMVNLGVGYDVGGFSARISMSYQGRTLSSLGNREEIDGYTDKLVRFDFLVKQKISTWMSIFGAWNNITNSADQSYIQVRKYADEKEYYGWTADVGLMITL